jgi:hypothetical protein
MRKRYIFIAAFGILFLFFIQMAGTLVESIYILDLMHTSLDEKALGTLFFFTPVLLLFIRNKTPNLLVWSMTGLLFFTRGMTPYLNTSGRLLASGIGTGSALILLGLLAAAKPKGETLPRTGWWVSAGLALAVSLSVLLRWRPPVAGLGGGWACCLPGCSRSWIGRWKPRTRIIRTVWSLRRWELS